MFGGKADLESAIARGAAVTASHNGVEMIMFPKVKIGRRDQYDQEATLKRSKQTTQRAFEDVHNTIKQLGWAINADKSVVEEPMPCTNT